MLTAVLSKNRRIALDFLREKYGNDISYISVSRGEVVLKSGRRLILITNEVLANVHTFDDYIISPCYSSLEDLVKTRCRPLKN